MVEYLTSEVLASDMRIGRGFAYILGLEAAAGRANRGSGLDPHTYAMDGASASGKTVDRQQIPVDRLQQRRHVV